MSRRDIIFTVADPLYFNEYAVPLVVSAIEHKMPLYLGILNPDNKTKALLALIADYVIANNAEDLVSFQIEETEIPEIWDKKVWAACGRLRHAARYFENMPADSDDRLFLLDIDSVIRTRFTFPHAALALVIDPLREGNKIVEATDTWAKEGSKILMSGFFTSYTLPLLQNAVKICENLHYGRWMLDQYALQQSVNQFRFSQYSSLYVDSLLNLYGTNYLHYGPWKNDGFVWTGKYNSLATWHPFRKLTTDKFSTFLQTVLNLPQNDDLHLKGLLAMIGYQPEMPYTLV